MAKVYFPTEGRVIVFQKRANKTSSGIYLAPEAIEKTATATVVAVYEDSKFKVNDEVFFDYSSGTKISDDDSGVYTVLDETDILAIVKEV